MIYMIDCYPVIPAHAFRDFRRTILGLSSDPNNFGNSNEIVRNEGGHSI